MEREYILRCRHCGEVGREDTVVLITAWYMIHTVKNHWAEVEVLHNASDETIAAAYGLAVSKGWLKDTHG